MRFALNRYKLDRENGWSHPGEARTTSGRFSGDGNRLVYVDRSGSLRDYTYPLSGKTGIERSRLGIQSEHGIQWLDFLETTSQKYYDDSTVIVTEHDAGHYQVNQYDLTLEETHVTHVELRGDYPADARLVAALTFAPDGKGAAGRLVHDDVVEVYHDVEHDYVTASTGLTRATGQVPEHFSELLDEEPVPFPREGDQMNVDDPLTDTVLVAAPLHEEGAISQSTLVTLLTDHRETPREDALARVRAVGDHYPTDKRIRTAAERQQSFTIGNVPHRGAVTDDLRTVEMLTADATGARIKGPEYDPHHVYSGGYGYTWFRDDAEVARSLLAAEEGLSLDLGGCHGESASFYMDTQLDDGTWPHRVWARNGSLAPGWANAKIEGSGTHYQADQTASVVTFLASYYRTRSLDPDEAARVESTLEDAVAGLDSMLDDDGIPSACQNLWENYSGRFTHTAGTFLEAYAALARAPVSDELAERARERATTVYEALDDLWVEDREVYAMRETEDGLDDRLDAGTFVLVDAHREYSALTGSLPTDRLDRLATHVETTISGLYRDPAESDVEGLVRFEGDDWRVEDQDGPKIWTLATAWGANAAAGLETILDRHGYDPGTSFEARATTLLSLLLPEGPLCMETGYLPEQVFDDGTADSATPRGWSHAHRLATIVHLHEEGMFEGAAAPARPSGPEERPTWTTGEKYGVATANDHGTDDPSRVWFSLTEGALSEPRFPRVDLMNFRSIDFLVVDADDDHEYTARTHLESRKDLDTSTIERSTRMVDSDALVFSQEIRETSDERQWTVDLEYVCDHDNEAILMDVAFSANDDHSYDVYVIGDASLSNRGSADVAERVETDHGYALTAYDTTGDGENPAVVDERGEVYNVATGIASAREFEWASACAAGTEGLRSLISDGERGEASSGAGPDNIVLVGMIGEGVGSVADTLAIGFAEDQDTETALAQATGALDRGYVRAREEFVTAWQEYVESRPLPQSVRAAPALTNQYKAAVMVLRAVEDKTFSGGGLASPSVPWGEAVHAAEPRDYGYNFVWSRDLYQVFTALDATDDVSSAVDALEYLYTRQQRQDGFIPQNTYLDGRTRWGGEQMDNIAFPQVMAYQLQERHGIDFSDVAYGYEHVRRSAEYMARNGPASAQERWEEEGGYSPSTIAAEIAGLACAAALADDVGYDGDARFYLALADEWARGVEEWCVSEEGTDQHTNTPYYFRVSRNGIPDQGTKRQLANDGPTLDERNIIDGGFLELVRLGIKSWDDEIVRNTLQEYDDTIKVDTPNGPGWYRYNGDGYGEQGEQEPEEGGPWTGEICGQGRLWPIFSGERGEYELLAGTADGDLAPSNLLTTMQRFSNSGRMIPEQVWDQEYSTAYNWEFGEGTGAATPLAWSMAQYVRLAHGIDAGEPVETPAFLRERYREHDPVGPALTTTLPEGPVDESTATVSGETRGDAVVVRVGERTVPADVADDGAFTAAVDLTRGVNQITVVATDEADDLAAVGTTIDRGTVVYEP